MAEIGAFGPDEESKLVTEEAWVAMVKLGMSHSFPALVSTTRPQSFTWGSWHLARALSSSVAGRGLGGAPAAPPGGGGSASAVVECSGGPLYLRPSR